MFPLGHVGLTLAAAEAARRTRAFAWLARVPVAWLAVGAMLPDAVDKPLGHGLLDWGAGRLFGHSLLFVLLLAALAAVAWQRSPRWGPIVVALALGSATHLVFDLIWRQPAVVLWPFLGPIPKGDFRPIQWVAMLFTDPFVRTTEVLGAGGLAWSLREEWRRRVPRRRIVPTEPAAPALELAAPTQSR